MLCLLGQSVVYEEASDLLNVLLGHSISAPQIQRVCLHYGTQLACSMDANDRTSIAKLEITDKSDPVYAMMDGSMIYTREDEWRELKLGRIFQGSQLVELQPSRKEIRRSLYVAHVGSINEFLPRLEWHLLGYENKVILGDGAKWIWNWADDNYPGATQILDFYHAKEKLVLFSKHQFREDEVRLNWLKQQSDLLLDNGVEKVIQVIKKCRARNEAAKEAKQKAISYYLEHSERMQYKTYKDKGLLIGSGPIEAANRSVIQQRMKLSGQKWSVKGANAIAQLRCLKASNDWSIVTRAIQKAA